MVTLLLDGDEKGEKRRRVAWNICEQFLLNIINDRNGNIEKEGKGSVEDINASFTCLRDPYIYYIFSSKYRGQPLFDVAFDNVLCSGIIDEDNEDDLTHYRFEKWVEKLKKEINSINTKTVKSQV